MKFCLASSPPENQALASNWQKERVAIMRSGFAVRHPLNLEPCPVFLDPLNLDLENCFFYPGSATSSSSLSSTAVWLPDTKFVTQLACT